MWKEFKEFAVKGNAIDLAVGVIIGVAFGSVIGSLVKDIFMPPIGLLTGGLDLTIVVARQHLEDLAFQSPLNRAQAVGLFGMALAHVMRQTRRVGDEERGHWLMSCLPNAPSLSLRGTFARLCAGNPIGHDGSWLERLGFATQVFGLRLSIPVEARGFTMKTSITSGSQAKA